MIPKFKQVMAMKVQCLMRCKGMKKVCKNNQKLKILDLAPMVKDLPNKKAPNVPKNNKPKTT